MFPSSSGNKIFQVLIVVAVAFYVFNNPASAAQTVNKAMHAAATFFGALG